MAVKVERTVKYVVYYDDDVNPDDIVFTYTDPQAKELLLCELGIGAAQDVEIVTNLTAGAENPDPDAISYDEWEKSAGSNLLLDLCDLLT